MKNSIRTILISTLGVSLLWWMGGSFGDVTAAQSNVEASRKDVGVGSITLLGITIGHSNLADVRRKFGPNSVQLSGDAATAANMICYTTEGAAPVVIVFASNAEMAGPPENIVTDVSILVACNK